MATLIKVPVKNASEVRLSFNTLTEAQAGDTGTATYINVAGLSYVYDAAGTALTTFDGRTWSPTGDDITDAHFGCVGDSPGLSGSVTSGTDDGAALERFFAWIKAGNVGRLRPRVYRCDRKLDLGGSDWTLHADGAFLDFRAMPNGDGDSAGSLVSVSGSAGSTVAISSIQFAEAANSTRTTLITCASAHGRSVGDDVLASSDDVADLGHDAVNETRGQFFKVERLCTILALTGSVTVVAGETLTQATSGATGVVVADTTLTDGTIYVAQEMGAPQFDTVNPLSGSTSGALGANSIPSSITTGRAFTSSTPLLKTLTTNPVLTPVTWREGFRITGKLGLIGPGRRPTAAGYGGLDMTYCRDASVDTIQTDGVDYQAVSRDSCLRVHLDKLTARFDPQGGSTAVQYGDTYKNCTQDCTTGLIVSYGGKHAFDWTRNTNPGIGSHCRVGHLIAYYTWDAAAAMHGNAINCSFGLVEAFDCLYGVGIRAPGWRVDHVNAEHCYKAVLLSQNPRDVSLPSVRARDCDFGIHASDVAYIGQYEAGQINIGVVDFDGGDNNAINLDFSTIPVFTQASAAVTGGSSTTITMGDFPNAMYNASGALTSAEIVMDYDGGGVGTSQTRTITGHTYAAGTNTLTVSGWTNNPQAGVSTYSIRSFVPDVTVERVVSRNCGGADVNFYGNFRRLRIGSVTVSHEAATSAACLQVQGTASVYPENITIGPISNYNKLGPSLSGNVKALRFTTPLTPHSFGAVGNTAIDTTTQVQAAVTFCNTWNQELHFPDYFLTSASITNLHNVRKRGPGGLKIGSAFFEVEQLAYSTNPQIIYVDASSGNDANDGLSTGARAVATIGQAAAILKSYNRAVQGQWTISPAAGTYTEAVDLSWLENKGNRITIAGPTVAHPSVPTVTIAAPTAGSTGFSIGQGGRARLQYVKFSGFTSGQAINNNGGYLSLTNVHGVGCWKGIINQHGGFTAFTGGDWDGTGADAGSIGYTGFYNAKHDIGHASTAEATVFHDYATGMQIGEGTQGHLDYIVLEDNTTGVDFKRGCGACNTKQMTIRRNGVGVLAQNAGWYDNGILWGTGADANTVNVRTAGSAPEFQYLTQDNRFLTMRTLNTTFIAQATMDGTEKVFFDGPDFSDWMISEGGHRSEFCGLLTTALTGNLVIRLRLQEDTGPSSTALATITLPSTVTSAELFAMMVWTGSGAERAYLKAIDQAGNVYLGNGAATLNMKSNTGRFRLTTNGTSGNTVAGYAIRYSTTVAG